MQTTTTLPQAVSNTESDSSQNVASTAAAAFDATQQPPRDLWSEVAAVVAIALVPIFFSAFSKVIWPEIVVQKPFNYIGSYMVLRSIWISVPILFIIHISRTPPSTFGLTRFQLPNDIATGVVIWFFGMAACWLFWKGFLSFSPGVFASSPSAPARIFSRPEGLLGFSLLIAGCLGNGFTEELAFRGYLMPRLERLLGPISSLYLTTALFAAAHVYQGMAGMMTTAILGLVYGAAFFWLRRLWPIALAHAIADFFGFINLPG